MRTPDPDDPGAPVHEPVPGPPPSPDDVRGMLAGVIDPELHASIVDLGMVDDVRVGPDGGVMVKVALTTAGCPLRAQIRQDVESKVRGLRGVTAVKVEYGEMTREQKTAAMQRARFNAREQAAPTEVPSTTRVLAVASGKGGVGKSSVTVNLAAALAARGLTVGVLDADIWGFSVPRMLGVEGRLGGSDGKITPNVVSRAGARTAGPPARSRSCRWGSSSTTRAPRLMWRGLILTKALEQFLTDVRWGDMDYLLIDMPPGTGDMQMGLARMLPQAEMLVVTTPALAAQKVATRVADMARRSYMKVVGRGREHERVRGPRRLPPRGLRPRWRRGARRRDRGAARRPHPDRAGGVERRRHRRAGRAHRRPTAPPVARSPSSPPASSTSCCPRSRWAGAPPACSTSWARSSRRRRATSPGRRPGSYDASGDRLLDVELALEALRVVVVRRVALRADVAVVTRLQRLARGTPSVPGVIDGDATDEHARRVTRRRLAVEEGVEVGRSRRRASCRRRA